MKQQSKKIIEDLLEIITNTCDIDVELIKRDLNSVLFLESINPSKKFSMYAYCDKSSFMIYHHGVFHDPKDKLAVVTDGHILCYSKENYVESFDGKVIDQYGKALKCQFPNWRSVTNNLEKSGDKYHFKTLDLDKIDIEYRKAKVWASVNLKKVKSSREKEGKMLFNIDNNYFSIDNIRKISLALREFAVDGINVCDDYEKGRAAFYMDDENGVLLMPVVYDKYEEKNGFYVVKL